MKSYPSKVEKFSEEKCPNGSLAKAEKVYKPL